MTLRNFLLAAAALPGLVLAQDGSMCMVKTTVVPVYVTTTIGGPATTNTLSAPFTVSVVPTPEPTFNLATAPAGSAITEGSPIVLIYNAPQPNMAATIDLVQVGPSPGSYIGSKRDTSTVEVKTITTNAMGGNFTWTPDTTLPPANNYALKVSQNGQQVELSPTFVLVAAPMMSSSMSMSASSSMMMSSSTSMVPPPATSLTKAAPVTSSSMSASAPTVTSNPSTSSVKVISTAAPATINGGGAVVETQYVQGAPKTSVVNTFSTTVTATSTAYAQTSTAVATSVATATSVTYTSTAVVTVTPQATQAAVATQAKVENFNGILTITVTTTAIPQARRGAAGFFGF